MGKQIPLFSMSEAEVMLKARQLVTCRRHLHELGRQLKEARQALRECSEAEAVKDIMRDVKSTRETADRLLSELDAESLATVDAETGEIG